MATIGLDRLSKSECFAGLSEEQVGRITECGAVREYETGDVIFEESSQSSDMFVLLSGRVCVEIDAPSEAGGDHEHLQLAILRDGDVFGEIAFLEGRRRSARIRALDNAVALNLDGKKLYSLFDNDPRLGYRVISNLARVLAQRVVDVNFKWRQDHGTQGVVAGAAAQPVPNSFRR